MRADARRNYDRLVATARAAFEADGPDASLDLVAKRAGVGPGTLYRHFPTRRDLQQAVYRETIEETAGRAAGLAATLDPPAALRAWLEHFVVHLSARRGLAETLLETMSKQDELFVECHRSLHAAGGPLLEAARETGAVRDDVTLSDVLWLANGIAYAAQGDDGPDRSARLLDIVLAERRAKMEASERPWQPRDRDRTVSKALRAYAAMATSADTGAVRRVP